MAEMTHMVQFGTISIPIRIAHSGLWNENEMYHDYQVTEVYLEPCTPYSLFMLSIMTKLGIQDSISIPPTYVSLGLSQYLSKGVKFQNDNDVKWLYNVLTAGTLNGCTIIVDLRHCIAMYQNHVLQSSTTDIFRCPESRFHHSLDLGRLPVDFKVRVDDIFSGKKQLQNVLSAIALRNNYQFLTKKSTPKFLVVVCVDPTCTWKVSASRRGGVLSDTWVVKKVVDQHLCSLDVVMRNQKQASASLIKDMIINKVTFMGREYEKPHTIMKYVRTHHGINISYHKAYRAKQSIMKAMYGNPDESYALLPSYSEVLTKKNPGSKGSIKYSNDLRFLFNFIALAASIEGWKYCRPCIRIDGTFIKSKYGGTLLVATTSDGNNQIFPLAFAAVDSENDESWKWFVKHMKKRFGNRENIVVISDRHKSISNAMDELWPQAFHVMCIFHLNDNMIKKHKSKWDSGIFFTLAKAYNVYDFEFYMRHLENGCPGIRAELQKIGYDRWSRAYCPRKRYEAMTNNSCESFNNVILYARELPITSMFEVIRMLLQGWFSARRHDAGMLTTNLTEECEKQMKPYIDKGHLMQVHSIDTLQFQVLYGIQQYHVNLADKSCTCGEYDHIEIPCAHACAVLLTTQFPPMQYVSHHYHADTLRKTYAGLIYPLGPQDHWDVPQHIRDKKLLPPTTKRPVGRPKKQRMRSFLEVKNRLKCGRCGQLGHNRKTCRNAFTQ